MLLGNMQSIVNVVACLAEDRLQVRSFCLQGTKWIGFRLNRQILCAIIGTRTLLCFLFYNAGRTYCSQYGDKVW